MRHDRPCTGPTRNQCRARGPSKQPPAKWNPRHGWFCMPLVLSAALALGCVRPAPMGLARVQLCVSYEKGGRGDGPPRASKGASACADFEPAQPAAEPE